MVQIFAALLAAFFIILAPVKAHPGRTDEYGCHTCHTNCPSWGLQWEEYHCNHNRSRTYNSSMYTSEVKISNKQDEYLWLLPFGAGFLYLIYSYFNSKRK